MPHCTPRPCGNIAVRTAAARFRAMQFVEAFSTDCSSLPTFVLRPLAQRQACPNAPSVAMGRYRRVWAPAVPWTNFDTGTNAYVYIDDSSRLGARRRHDEGREIRHLRLIARHDFRVV